MRPRPRWTDGEPMAEILIVSFSDLGRDPRVDRQIVHLAGRWDVVVAGLGAPAHDVPYVALGPGTGERTEAPAARGLRLARLVLGRHEAAYWGSADVRRALRRLGSIRADLILANDLHALPLALRLAAGRARV